LKSSTVQFFDFIAYLVYNTNPRSACSVKVSLPNTIVGNDDFHGEPEEKLRYYVLHEEPEEWFILL
jgi:hypothetical protein